MGREIETFRNIGIIKFKCCDRDQRTVISERAFCLLDPAALLQLAYEKTVADPERIRPWLPYSLAIDFFPNEEINVI